MNLLITSTLAVITGCLFGKALGKSIVWVIERKWGKHYQIKFKDYDDKPAVIHLWTKDDLSQTYGLMIQQAHNMIKEGVAERVEKFERVQS